MVSFPYSSIFPIVFLFIHGMLVAGDESSSEQRVAGDGGDDNVLSPVDQANVQRRRVRAARKLQTYVVVGSEKTSDCLFDGIDIGLAEGENAIMGVVTASWVFVSVADMQNKSYRNVAAAMLRGNRFPIHGFVVYEIHHRAQCPTVIASADATPMSLWDDAKQLASGGALLADVVQHWQDNHNATQEVMPVVLSPAYAFNVVAGNIGALRVVPIKGKVRDVYWLEDRPHKRALKRWLQEPSWDAKRLRQAFGSPDPGGDDGGDDGDEAAARNVYERVPVDVVIDWVACRKYCKNIANTCEAAESFAKVLARNGQESAASMVARMVRVGRECLRKARVRVDFVWRAYFAMVVDQDANLNINIYTDSSPQRRGLDMYASSFDFVQNGMMSHNLFTIVETFGSDAIGKCFTLIWQIFLQFGPDFQRVLTFLAKVVSIVCDGGTERLLADMAFCLNEFTR